jgi:hypothetical protein
MTKIEDHMLAAAAHIHDLDEALRSVMDQVGITDGGVAGMVFSGDKDHSWWPNATYAERMEMLWHWAAAEEAAEDEPPRTAEELEALLVKYMARVIDCESISYLDRAGHAGIDFGDDLDYLRSIEERARKEYDL